MLNHGIRNDEDNRLSIRLTSDSVELAIDVLKLHDTDVGYRGITNIDIDDGDVLIVRDSDAGVLAFARAGRIDPRVPRPPYPMEFVISVYDSNSIDARRDDAHVDAR
jgi:hypothetical protein